MSNSYYNHTSGVPAALSVGQSALIRAEFDLVEDGFDAVGVLLNKGLAAEASSVAAGAGALAASTTGTQNTAIGAGAMGASTTGDTCVAVGASAMALANGNWNTAVGGGALLSTTGTANTAIGLVAGQANTTGSNNSFIGNGAAGATATTSNAVTLGNASVATLRCQVTSITALSDARDKTHVRPLPHGLDFTNSLRPVAFTWNTRDGAKVGIPSSGFIAQELQAAQNAAGAADTLNLVYDVNPDKLEATYGHLIPVLVKAIQELSAKVEALENDKR